MASLQSVWRSIVEISTVVACLAAVFFGWLTIRVTREVAQQSGAFDKPELRLLLGSHELEPGVKSLLILGAPPPEERSVSYASIPFVLRNTGQKSAKNVDVVDSFPKLARSPLQGLIKFEVEGVVPRQSQFTQEMKDMGQATYIHYAAESLDPGINVGLHEPFILDKTEFEGEMEVKRVTAHYAVRYALQQLLTVGAEDQPRRNYPVDVAVTNVRGEPELKQRVEAVLSERLAERRAGLPYLASLWQTLREDAYFAFVEPKLAAEQDGIRFYEAQYPVESVHAVTVIWKPRFLTVLVYTVDALMILTTVVVLFGRWRRRREPASV